MAQTVPPAYTPLGPVPTTADPANFDFRADNFLAALPTFQTELDATADVTYDNAVDAFNSATAAAVSAGAALASQATSATNAAAAAASAGAAAWNPATNYAQGVRAIDPTSQRVYYRKVAGVSATAPSADSVNWGVVQLSKPLQIVTGRTVAAVPEVEYLLTNTASSVTNVLLWSQDLTNAAWTKNGTATAINTDTLSFPAFNEAVLQPVTMAAGVGVSATFSPTLSGSGTIYIGVSRSSGGTYEETKVKITLTSVPTRYSITHTIVNVGQLGFTSFLSRGPDGTATIVQVNQTQMETGVVVGPYVPTTTAAVTVNRGSDLVLPLLASEGDSIDVSWDNGLYTNRVLRPLAPELVTNGSFVSSATGWTNASTGGSSIAWNVGAYLDLIRVSGLAAAYQAVATVVGKTYAAAVDKRGTNVVTNIGTTVQGSELYSEGSTNINTATTFVATSTTTYVTVNRVTAGTSNVDNITVREVPPTIMGVAQDMTLDHAPAGRMSLRLQNNSWRF